MRQAESCRIDLIQSPTRTSMKNAPRAPCALALAMKNRETWKSKETKQKESQCPCPMFFFHRFDTIGTLSKTCLMLRINALILCTQNEFTTRLSRLRDAMANLVPTSQNVTNIKRCSQRVVSSWKLAERDSTKGSGWEHSIIKHLLPRW